MRVRGSHLSSVHRLVSDLQTDSPCIFSLLVRPYDALDGVGHHQRPLGVCHGTGATSHWRKVNKIIELTNEGKYPRDTVTMSVLIKNVY